MAGPTRLLDDEALDASPVVANRAMNRGRQLTGVNSYARELGFDPVERIVARLRAGERAGAPGPGTVPFTVPDTAAGTVGWLDLCCGTGLALRQAAERLHRAGLAGRTALVGVDLVDAFAPAPPSGGGQGPELVCASVATWRPTRAFDLITCVHGLHYVGDKLALLARAATWLTGTGTFVADLDLSSVRLADGRPAGRRLTAELRAAGFAYDARRRRISRSGNATLRLPYRYLGADDRAGANYTGQPAVHAYYAEDR